MNYLALVTNAVKIMITKLTPNTPTQLLIIALFIYMIQNQLLLKRVGKQKQHREEGHYSLSIAPCTPWFQSAQNSNSGTF